MAYAERVYGLGGLLAALRDGRRTCRIRTLTVLRAVLVMLLALLAYDLFHSFHRLNLKPALRLPLTLSYLSDLVTVDFYQHEHLPHSHSP